jgi:hypothetical protein
MRRVEGEAGSGEVKAVLGGADEVGEGGSGFGWERQGKVRLIGFAVVARGESGFGMVRHGRPM